MLRWHLDRGCVPIPKAASLHHQKENIDLFDFKLTKEEVDKINALDKGIRIVNTSRSF